MKTILTTAAVLAALTAPAFALDACKLVQAENGNFMTRTGDCGNPNTGGFNSYTVTVDGVTTKTTVEARGNYNVERVEVSGTAS